MLSGSEMELKWSSCKILLLKHRQSNHLRNWRPFDLRSPHLSGKKTGKGGTQSSFGRSVLWNRSLLDRREVAFLGPNLVAAVVAIEIDGTELPIGLEVCRNVGECVLAAQLFLNAGKSVGDIFGFERLLRWDGRTATAKALAE